MKALTKLASNVMKVDELTENMIEDLNLTSLSALKNKEEVEHELIVASRAIGRVYSLIKKNLEKEFDKEKDSC